jgi:hypothetical protein
MAEAEKRLAQATAEAAGYEHSVEVGRRVLAESSPSAEFALALGPLSLLKGTMTSLGYMDSAAALYMAGLDAAASRRQAEELVEFLEAARTRYAELGRQYATKEKGLKLATSRAEAAQSAYEEFVEMTNNAVQTVFSRGYSVQVLTRAIPRRSPSRPNVPLNTAAGLGAGILLGLVAVGLEHYRRGDAAGRS